MSEKITPQQAVEASTQLVADLKYSHLGRRAEEALATELQSDLSHNMVRIDQLGSEIDSYEAGASSDQDAPYELSLEKTQQNHIDLISGQLQNIRESAASLALTKVAEERADRKATAHYLQNEDAYYDAAVAEATQDGIKLNLPSKKLNSTDRT